MLQSDATRTARAAWAMVNIAGCLVLLATLVGCGEIHHARMADNEATAVIKLREIHTAQDKYHSRFGHYAVSLKELEDVSLISSLATGGHKGYQYRLRSNGNEYMIDAAPNKFNETGARTLFSDQSGKIHEHYGPEVASASDPQVH